MLLHDKTQTLDSKTRIPTPVANEAAPIFVHASKLTYTLQSSQQDWESDFDYFKAIHAQLLSLCTKGNMKNGEEKNELKSQLYKMEALIDEDTMSLMDRLSALAYEFKNSDAPKLGTIFQEYADLEEEFQTLRNSFRRLTVDILKEVNKVCPVRIF